MLVPLLTARESQMKVGAASTCRDYRIVYIVRCCQHRPTQYRYVAK